MPMALAQNDFVAINNGDTIYGKVMFDLPESLTESVTIKNDDGKQSFKSNRIVLVQAKGKTYRSIRYANKYRLMQEVIPGYLSLFKYRDSGFEFSTNFLYKATGEGIATSSISFKRSIANFLSECPKLSSAIADKVYGFRDIKEVVARYNSTCIKEVSQSSTKVDLRELQHLLDDILSRQEKGEPVPDYLKTAVKEYAEKDLRKALLGLVEMGEN